MNIVINIFGLLLCGVVANFLMLIVLNLAGLPGALVAGMPGKRSKRRFIIGSLVSAIGQSYVNLAYVAFLVSWTIWAGRQNGVLGFVLWPFAFLPVVAPTWINLIRARVESREIEHANAQAEGLHLTFLFTLVGFVVFACAPFVMKAGWGWVPLVSR